MPITAWKNGGQNWIVSLTIKRVNSQQLTGSPKQAITLRTGLPSTPDQPVEQDIDVFIARFGGFGPLDVSLA